ncbi:MAG: tetratricopeptide repeat protein, partial [Brevinema sp.]
MSFADIFNAYSSKVSPEGRADAITSHPDIPGNVLYALSNALEENRPDVIGTDEPEDIDVSVPETPEDDFGDGLSAEDRDKLMGSFASLDDEPALETPAKPVEEISAPDPVEEIPTPEPIEEIDAPEEISEAFSAFDSLPDDFVLDDEPIEEAVLEQNADEGDISLDDDLGFDLLAEGEDTLANPNDDDWDMPFDLSSEVEAPEFESSNDLLDLEIESPEDLQKEVTEEPAQEFEMPDFSDTNLETTPEDEVPLPEPIDIPAEEVPSSSLSSPDFDLFSTTSPSTEDVDSAFNLSEEQVFLIREKINSIKNKNLRFELRNIMIDPKYYGEHYDGVLSLLLVDASEEKIAAFLQEFAQSNDGDAIMPSVLTKSARATFLADDVENYEHFKEDFRRVARRVTIAAIAIITLSVVLWSTVAQPLRIDNLYRRGLTAVREDRFTDGENLYTRAQQVAGRPNLKWTLEYGSVYESKTMVRLAEQKYRTALLIAPKDIPAAKQVAAFYTNLTPPNYPSALAIFSKLSSLYPKNFTVWDFYGLIYIGQAETLSNNIVDRNEAYFNAAGVYRDFIIKNINNPAPYYRLLEIYIQLDSAEKINQIYALIEQLEPKEYNIAILSRLAGYFIDRKQLTEAERIFRRAIPYIDKNIGNLEGFRKRLDKEFNIPASSISNILGSAYYEFARYNMLSSDVPRAIRLLTNALIFAPSNANVHNLMGEAVMISPGSTERIVEAKRHFDNAARLDGNNYKPQVNLGHLYFYNERALTDIDDAYAKALYHYRLAV